jgi:hypothetical protein
VQWPDLNCCVRYFHVQPAKMSVREESEHMIVEQDAKSI